MKVHVLYVLELKISKKNFPLSVCLHVYTKYSIPIAVYKIFYLTFQNLKSKFEI